MKLIRTLVLGLFALSFIAGCGPKKEDTDPKADELNLNIDDGEGDAGAGTEADKAAG